MSISWENHIISDLVNFIGGSQPPQKEFVFEDTPGYVRLIQTRDYKTDRYKTFIKKSSSRRSCTKDDVMIGRYGPPVFQILRGLEGSYNVALIKAEPKSGNLLKEYLYFYLSRNDLFLAIDRLSRRSSGQTGIDMDFLNNFEFLLPSVSEQKAIAETLSTWDLAIEKTEKLIAAKEKWLFGTYQDYFSKSGIRKRDWKRVPLGEIFTEVTRSVGTQKLEPYSISAGKGFVSQADKFGRDISGAQYGNYAHLKAGDFAYNKGNSKRFKQGCIYLLEQGEIAVPKVFICFTPKAKDIVTDFYKHYFLGNRHAQELRMYISSGARGDGLLNVNTDDFFQIRVPYPPASQQKTIAAAFEAVSNEISILKQLLTKQKLQKNGLMQKLLTGAWRVNIAEKGKGGK